MLEWASLWILMWWRNKGPIPIQLLGRPVSWRFAILACRGEIYLLQLLGAHKPSDSLVCAIVLICQWTVSVCQIRMNGKQQYEEGFEEVRLSERIRSYSPPPPCEGMIQQIPNGRGQVKQPGGRIPNDITLTFKNPGLPPWTSQAHASC